jgi:hypothetical protein
MPDPRGAPVRAVRSVAGGAALALTLWAQASLALEGAGPSQPTLPEQAPSQPDVVTTERPEDPTGGAYASPTLLFIPAAAVPKWNVRVILSSELQAPADVDAVVRPGVGAEIGLPAGFTLGAGTTWVGGDINPNTNKTDFNLGLSPYAQLRFNIIGRPDGRGFLLGVSTTYKFVGFEGDPGEEEFAVSAQYRQRYYELGLQGVIGKDFASTSADGEVHAYAAVRPIPQLAIGAASQVRLGLVSQPGDPSYDFVGGAIASLTLGRFQVGTLAGASTLGLQQSHLGGLGQLFGSARF